VPGPITHENAFGPNSLIRDGATPITEPEDIALALGLTLACKEILLDAEGSRVADAIRAGHDTPDDLAAFLDVSPEEIAVVLTRLELEGAVRPLGGGRYTLYTAR